MKTHLALLRGINVSGHNMIKMDALKKALEAIGFTNVETYIQSGNVFVQTEEESAAKVGFVIKQEIFKTFGHDVPVVVIGKEDLELCLERNPFLKEAAVDTKKLYVSFVSMELKSDSIHDLKISNIKPDEVHIDQSRIYIKYFDSPAKTRLDNNYIEKRLNVVSTIRNWNTVNKLLEMYNS
ncbi:DUF1697 domain-containing protein [Flavobacterium sp. SUN046]|uniref:DUF1697 domain-containing protein n=1 Tax=Flavobacterium sp. SUN046 TaxID=3002440 RepID=UPI002DBD41B6|nr:DUF1697 domain-containing protein [Flavobacterium sp. SUN046]MEC4050648.1 DUF1697 domain-containing protein [Flavobacterium sp. SUN046]